MFSNGRNGGLKPFLNTNSLQVDGKITPKTLPKSAFTTHWPNRYRNSGFFSNLFQGNYNYSNSNLILNEDDDDNVKNDVKNFTAIDFEQDNNNKKTESEILLPKNEKPNLPLLFQFHKEIANGAFNYITKQTFIILCVIKLTSLVILQFVNLPTSIAFVIGGVFSLFAGFISMKIATNTNVKVALEANFKSLNNAFHCALKAGSLVLCFLFFGIIKFKILLY
tara:strand:- start:104 stop:769 length:666 start_codon:yes stop_codon:yes gene_type:complete